MPDTFPITVDATNGAGVYPINLGPESTSGIFVKDSTTRYIYIEDGSGENFIYKSILNGASGSWIKQDAAHSPTGLSRDQICLCRFGEKIRLAAVNGLETVLSLYEFDTDTDTWALFSNTLPLPPSGAFDIDQLCVMVGDTMYLVGRYFLLAPDSTPQVGYVTLTGSTWGSYVAVECPVFPGAPPVGIRQCCLLYTGLSLLLYLGYASTNPDGIHDGLFQANLLSSPAVQRISVPAVGLEGPPKPPWQGCAQGGRVSIGVFSISGGGFFYGDALDNGGFPNYTFTTVPGATITANFSLATVSTVPVLFYSEDSGGGVDTVSYAPNGTGPVLIGTATEPIASFGFNSVGTGAGNFFAICFAGSVLYWEQVGILPPPPTPAPIPKAVGGGATYFPRYLNKTLLLASIARIYGTDWILPRDIPFPPLSSFFLFPNISDLCLSREFQLYNLIDPLAMSCARKPDCFLQSERDWLDSPPGWITFNPVKAVPLPAPGDGNVVVLSFRVPYGYDGAILAQYHSYTLGFTEGGGDIQWRVRADGRYLRDMGDMEVTIGSPKQLSPVYGGLQLRSGNLVEYVVSAPNTSGLLPPPGTGNILAGLHGIFYPRL